ncbi:MAG: OmpH family outer membrane protein [Desulfovibrionaceae bacterium]
MRRLFFVPVLVTMGLLAGCFQTENSAPAVGVVDTARVFRDSDAGKAGVKFLEGMQEKMQADLNEIQEVLKKNPNDQAAQQKLQETYMGFQQRMGAEQQNVVTLLNDATQRVLDTFRQQKKLSVILSQEATLSFDKAVDVTAEVIAELNKQKVEFKAVMPEAPAKAVAPAEAPKADAKADVKADAPKKDSKKAESHKKADSPKEEPKK